MAAVGYTLQHLLSSCYVRFSRLIHAITSASNQNCHHIVVAYTQVTLYHFS